MSSLLVIKGPNIGVKYTLDDHTSIGRGPENTIQILDAKSSRNHCEILRNGKTFQIRDTRSRNGVLVNSKRTTSKTLRRNDEIVIGATAFLFDTDRDLKNTRFSNKRVLFLSPTDERLIRLHTEETPAGVDEPTHGRERAAFNRELLCDLGDLFSSSQLPLPEALERILQTLLGVFGAECGCLLKWDAVLKEHVPLVVLSPDDEFSVSQSVIRTVLAEKQAVLLPPADHGKGTEKASTNAEKQLGPEAALGVPLLKNKEVTGLLYLELPNSDQILLHDVQMLQSVATLTQLAIEHSNTLEALKVEKSRSRVQADQLIGASPVFDHAMGLIRRVSTSDSTVLLSGETGTGKELAAREIHRRSGRADYPFQAVNCAAIPESLIEGELFGHERGAFTGADRMRRGLLESAHGGTILLDEIGEMTPSAQTKLLRFLQDKVIVRVGGNQPITVDVRIIAATNVHLAEAVARKEFREDLWYRLNIFDIHLPPLRSRPGDIRLLTHHFLRRLGPEANKTIRTISPDALRLLETHDWPGNVRELHNAIERASLMCDGDELLPEHFSVRWGSATPPEIEAFTHEGTEPDLNASSTLAEAEKQCIELALAATGWNQIQAARRLKIHRNTLHKKIVSLGLTPSGNS